MAGTTWFISSEFWMTKHRSTSEVLLPNPFKDDPTMYRSIAKKRKDDDNDNHNHEHWLFKE